MKRLIICLIAVGLLAVPAKAEGWFVELDTWYVQPDNSYQIGEFVDYDSDDWTTMPQSFDFDGDLSPELIFGYVWDDYGILTFKYWTYSDETSFFTDSDDWYANWFFGIDDGDMEHWYSFETDAWKGDVTWGRQWDGHDRFTGTWYVGLRIFEYEFTDDYYADFEDADVEYYGLFRNEADGWGFCGGFTGQYEINERFFLNGGIDLAFLRGDRSYTSWLQEDWSGSTFDHNESFTHDDELMPQYGLNIDLLFYIWEGFYGRFGYKYANWVDVTTYGLTSDDYMDQLFWGGSYDGSVYGYEKADNPEDVSWDGFYLGFGWDFGRTE